MEVDPDQLREAVESQHGGRATLVQAVPVRDEFQGQTAWEGVVHVFDLEGVPLATRAYAWSTVIDVATQRRRFYAVLHAGPVRSPVDAVRAAVLAELKEPTKDSLR
jgi:hypothetical protein